MFTPLDCKKAKGCKFDIWSKKLSINIVINISVPDKRGISGKRKPRKLTSRPNKMNGKLKEALS